MKAFVTNPLMRRAISIARPASTAHGSISTDTVCWEADCCRHWQRFDRKSAKSTVSYAAGAGLHSHLLRRFRCKSFAYKDRNDQHRDAESDRWPAHIRGRWTNDLQWGLLRPILRSSLAEFLAPTAGRRSALATQEGKAMPPFESKNLFLLHLTTPQLLVFERILEPLALPRDFELASIGLPVSHYYFLESGIASMVATSPEGKKAEIGLVGRDGVSPPALTMEAEAFSFDVMMQVGGAGRRVEARALAGFLFDQPVVRQLLARFLQGFFAQVAHTALSNAVHKIDVRLAKWILMCHDRMDGEEIELTHEYMATMLGVRRSSVTEALHILEGEHFIYSHRGLVIVRNRTSLEAFAADAYDVPGVSGRSWPDSGHRSLAAVQ
ncbi:Crp/Fnr family transcriptional regulator [Rhizobium sp. SRDI969]|uniref:Crp/Fnr family transcriptional regulator n=1 Tax=Rhizobium sp. SRDI969 TaxID=3138252 RepID=UPI0021A6ACFD|nr:Crp/Fnr family transcriptional regulator [Rhizobium leguminosarum]UWM80921.1 Crp/Fnr family transcriptional regulator [Rhizobium leguminosarum bv. viciae]